MAIKRVSDLPQIDQEYIKEGADHSITTNMLSDVALEVSMDNSVLGASSGSGVNFTSYQTTASDVAAQTFQAIVEASLEGYKLSDFMITKRNSDGVHEGYVTGAKTFKNITSFENQLQLVGHPATVTQDGPGFLLKDNSRIMFQRQGETIPAGDVKYIAYNGNTIQTISANAILSNSTLATTKALLDVMPSWLNTTNISSTINNQIQNYINGHPINVNVTSLSSAILNYDTISAVNGKAIHEYLDEQNYLTLGDKFDPTEMSTLIDNLRTTVSQNDGHYYVGGVDAKDSNNGLSASSAVKTLNAAIKLINKRRFVGDSKCTIHVMGDLLIDKGEYASQATLEKIYHPDLVQTKTLLIEGDAIKSGTDSTNGNNLKKCFREIKII